MSEKSNKKIRIVVGSIMLGGGLVSAGLIGMWIYKERVATHGIKAIFNLIPEDVFAFKDFRKGVVAFKKNPTALTEVLKDEYAKFNQYTADYIENTLPKDVLINPKAGTLLNDPQTKQFLEAFQQQESFESVAGTAKEKIVICSVCAFVGIVAGIALLILAFSRNKAYEPICSSPASNSPVSSPKSIPSPVVNQMTRTPMAISNLDSLATPTLTNGI